MQFSYNKVGIVIAGYLVIALTAFVVVMAGSHWGIGVSPDSVSYINNADYISGKGGALSTHYPPLYSSLLALSNLIVSDNIYTSSRYVHVLLYVVNTLLLASIIYSLTRSYLLTTIFSALFITSSQIYTLHIYALSEPLFLLLLFSGIYLLSRYEHSDRIYMVIIPALLISLSSLTRYTGIAAILATCLYMGFSLLRTNRPHLLAYIAASCAPIMSWLAFNMYTSDMIANRSIEIHLITINHLEAILQAFSTWFHVPHNTFSALTAIILIAVSVLSLHMHSKDIKYQHIKKFHLLLVIFIASYLAFVLISISFFDALIPLDFRILSPVFISLTMILISAISIVKGQQGNNSLTYKLSIGTSLLLVAVQIPAFSTNLNNYIQDGMGFSSRMWKQSTILQQLELYRGNGIIYTNAPEPIAIHAGMNAIMIPAMISPSNSTPRSTFDREIADMEKIIRSGRGVYVYFFNVDWRWYLPRLDTVISNMELTPVYQDNTGVVLTYNKDNDD